MSLSTVGVRGLTIKMVYHESNPTCLVLHWCYQVDLLFRVPLIPFRFAKDLCSIIPDHNPSAVPVQLRAAMFADV